MKYINTFENFHRLYGGNTSSFTITPEMRLKWAEAERIEQENKKRPIDNPPLKNIPVHKSTYLYHSTNIKNLYDIKKYGLIPYFGKTTKTAYGEYYDFDETGDPELQSLDFDGILFFSDEPQLGFSQWGFGDRKFYWNKCLLTVIQKNDTIFQKTQDERFLDYKGKKTDYADQISIYNCPIFIESGDWFSFENQKPKYILWGKNLKDFIKLNFSEKFSNPRDYPTHMLR
jgi:hypothetical protein